MGEDESFVDQGNYENRDMDGHRLSPEEELLVLDNVRRGAALLDKYRPDWHRRVSRESLHMRDSYLCVLGQIGGNYGSEIRILLEDSGLTDTDYVSYLPFEHGFTSNYNVILDDGNYWSFLNAAWVEELVERRQSG